MKMSPPTNTQCQSQGNRTLSTFLGAIFLITLSLGLNTFIPFNVLMLKHDLASKMGIHLEYATHSSKTKTTKRPKLFLHVGPAKTGTSAIQIGIESKRIKDLLALDNVNTISQKIVHSRDLLTERNGKYEFADDFNRAMEEQRMIRPDNHVLVSSEYIAAAGVNNAQCESWQGVLKSNSIKHWDLHVVITYRRLHDYLPSGWNQVFKFQREHGLPVGIRQHWPGTYGETSILTFEEWMASPTTWLLPSQNNLHHFAYIGYNEWKNCSDRVKLVDYHNPDIILEDGAVVNNVDLTTSFLCKGITGVASHTCSGLVEDSLAINGVSHHANGASNIDHGILADYAYKSGFINKRFTRPEVEKAIRNFVQDNDSITLPRKCPHTTFLDSLYKESLHYEEWAHSVLAGDVRLEESDGVIPPLSAEQLDEFNLDWNRSLEQEKFCTVDSVGVLDRDEWKEFFSGNFA